MAEGVSPPPPGFELEVGETPPPPQGFVLEKPKTSEPTEDSPSLLRRFFNTAKGIPIPMAGAAAGGAVGSLGGPVGTLLGTMGGGGLAEWLQQKMGVTDPSKLDIAVTTLAPGVGRALTPAYRLGKSALVSTLGSRELVAEAGEKLLKKWINPATTAKDLYAAAEATRKVIPGGETARAVDSLLKTEVNRMPLPQQEELLDILGPIKDFVTVGRGKGFQMIRSQLVADAMSDVRRLGAEASTAFRAGKSDIGNALNKVRAARLNDLEKAGVPEVKAASKAYRKEMALEDLGRMIAKPAPGTKIADFSRDNPLFKNAFEPKEWDLIDKVVKRVSFVVPTGMSGAIGRTLTTAAGGAAGGWTNPLGWMIGVAGPEAMRKFFTSAKGQAFIEGTLAKNIEMGPEWAAAAAMFARGLMARGEADTEQ